MSIFPAEMPFEMQNSDYINLYGPDMSQQNFQQFNNQKNIHIL